MTGPYVIDRPLDEGDLFFGRDRYVARVVEALDAEEHLLLLYGLTFVGKTSFVNHLAFLFEGRLEAKRLDLEKFGEEYGRPLHILVSALAQVLGGRAPDLARLDRAGETVPYLARYLRDLTATLTREVLLSFDSVRAPDLAPGSQWADDLLLLHQALQGCHGLTLMVVVEGMPQETNNPDLEGIPNIVLGPLSEDETADVLMVPVRGALAYDIDVVSQIHVLSGGIPWYVQLFGSVIYERRISAGWVGKTEAEDALPKVLEQAASWLEHIWEECTPEEQVTLSAMAELWGIHGAASAADIVRYLGKLDVIVPLADVERSLSSLTARGILQRMGGDTFRLSQRLLGVWVKTNQSVAKTIQETGRYKKVSPAPRSSRGLRRVDWTALALWGVAAILVFAIVYVWQSRRRIETVGLGGRPVTEGDLLGPGRGPTPVLPVPSQGTLSGHIVYQARDNESSPWSIYIMRADGSERTRLTEGPSNDFSPVLSPDGVRIAFVSDRDGNHEVYIMNADGSEPSNLTRDAANDWTPAWSPDGRYLLFSSFRDGNWEIYRIAADGTGLRRLTNNKFADYAPAWSPDGATIAFTSDRDGDLEIYLMDPEGGNQRNLTNNPATDQNPTWSPDGLLTWESYREDNMELFVCNQEGTDLHNMSRDAYADDRGGAWSPWGGALAYYSNSAGGWDIFIMDLEAGRKSNLTQSPEHEQSPHWGP